MIRWREHHCPLLAAVAALALAVMSCGGRESEERPGSRSGAGAAVASQQRGDPSVEGRVVVSIGAQEFTVQFDSAETAARGIARVRVLNAGGSLILADTLLSADAEPEESADASVFQLKNAAGRSVGMLLAYGQYPSAPGTGEAFRILVVQAGRLKALTPRVFSDGVPWSLDAGVDPLTRQLMPGDALLMTPWLLHFEARVPVALDLGCTPQRANCLVPLLPDSVAGLARFAVRAPFRPIEKRATLALFERPGVALPASLDVAPGDSIEALEGAGEVTMTRGKEWVLEVRNAWLHIRCRGRSGWIHGLKDLEAVGLPQAG
jgi:hypothetical protein